MNEYEEAVKELADALIDLRDTEAAIASYRELLKGQEDALLVAKDYVANLHKRLMDLAEIRLRERALQQGAS